MSRSRCGVSIMATVIALVLIVGAAWAQAPLYTWQDADGRRHYGDQPPDRDPSISLEFQIDIGELPALNSMQVPGDSPYRPLSPPEPPKPAEPAGAQPATCRALAQRLAKIQQALRAGYVEPRGNRLRAEGRQLQARYRQSCRRHD